MRLRGVDRLLRGFSGLASRSPKVLIVVVVAEELLYFSRLGSHFLSGWSFSLAGFAPVTATVFLSYVNCTDSISAGLTGSNHFTVYWKCMSV